MKNWILVLIAIVAFSGSALAAGVTYNFKPEYIEKIIEGTCYVHENRETIPDPEWVGDENEAPQIPKYTDAQWTKEVYRRIIIRDTKRGLKKKAKDEAAATANIPDDAVEVSE